MSEVENLLFSDFDYIEQVDYLPNGKMTMMGNYNLPTDKIYLNELLLEYPNLHNRVLEHNLKHRELFKNNKILSWYLIDVKFTIKQKLLNKDFRKYKKQSDEPIQEFYDNLSKKQLTKLFIYGVLIIPTQLVLLTTVWVKNMVAEGVGLTEKVKNYFKKRVF